MPNSSTTMASDASTTAGTPIPLSYGFVWATGKRESYFMLQNTGESTMDYTRVGFWRLGHGEWDGPSTLYINNLLVWNGGITPTSWSPTATPPAGFSGQEWQACLDGGPPMVFNFHSGCDSVIGSGLSSFTSNGPDQGTDVLWAQFPPGIQVLDWNRTAYYGIMRKQPIQFQTNTHQDDPSQWTDINPIGLWRGLRCRLFDANGNQTGYAFTTNPAWHFVDVLLRRKLFVEYNITYNQGPTPLPAAVAARFDWTTIYESAQYFDQFLSNGRRRFEGNYSFASQTTLQAVLTQILLCCRSFTQEYAGKIQLICDAARSPVFTFTREHILPGSSEFSDQPLHTGPNRVVGAMRDLLIPAWEVTIESIEGGPNTPPVVTFSGPHPANEGDWIWIGNTNTTYDRLWQVSIVPAVINPGQADAVYPNTLTLGYQGANFPASVGAGGLAGFDFSRFKNRYPEFWHKANMLARGAVGVGIARQRQKVKTQYDFATSTFDQVARISCYERDRLLGIDTTGANGQLASPYVPPKQGKFRTSMFARDAAGNLACAIRPGDLITLDSTVHYNYEGLYEVREPLTVYPPSASASASGDSLALTPSSSSGEIEFTVAAFNPDVLYDTSDQTAAGWLNVPGSDPGNNSSYTTVPLADGGQFAFWTGVSPSGQRIQMPSSGFPVANLLAWASAASANGQYHSAHVIQLCEVSNLQLTLQYFDGSEVWTGDVGFAALSWLDPATTASTDDNGMTWVEFTLLGGEEVLFGQGLLADGTTIELPAGWAWTDSSGNPTALGVAYVHDQQNDGNVMYDVGAYVDAENVVHVDASDDEDHTWHGNASVLVFAVKNNMGTVTFGVGSGPNWILIPLTNGMNFGVGWVKSANNGEGISLPAQAGNGATLQAICGSSLGTPISGANHEAQGVGSCYLDGSNEVHITFNDNNGDVWSGQADVFMLYCAPSTAPVVVQVAPLSVQVPVAAVQAFAAQVLGEANQAVTWSVDGVAGGNATVGTIDANGNYTAPSTSGSHTITATSVADTSVSGSATVMVTNGTNISISSSGGSISVSLNGQKLQTEEG